MEQVDGVEKVGKYIDNWTNYLEQKDLTGMNREYSKIKKKLENLVPIENTLKTSKRRIENVQTLIKNKGNSLENISEDELKLAKNNLRRVRSFGTVLNDRIFLIKVIIQISYLKSGHLEPSQTTEIEKKI